MSSMIYVVKISKNNICSVISIITVSVYNDCSVISNNISVRCV
jgi:hypothetical protein